MSKLRPLLERNRVFAATGARAGLAMKQLFGQRMVQSGAGRARRRTARQSRPLRPAETAN